MQAACARVTAWRQTSLIGVVLFATAACGRRDDDPYTLYRLRKDTTASNCSCSRAACVSVRARCIQACRSCEWLAPLSDNEKNIVNLKKDRDCYFRFYSSHNGFEHAAVRTQGVTQVSCRRVDADAVYLAAALCRRQRPVDERA